MLSLFSSLSCTISKVFFFTIQMVLKIKHGTFLIYTRICSIWSFLENGQNSFSRLPGGHCVILFFVWDPYIKKIYLQIKWKMNIFKKIWKRESKSQGKWYFPRIQMKFATEKVNPKGMTYVWRKKIHKKPKEDDIFCRWKYKIENYLDLQKKWDHKQNTNLVKITKKLTLFHKSKENIDENDSNPWGKWEFLLKKTLKKTFSKRKCKGFARIIGKWKFFGRYQRK